MKIGLTYFVGAATGPIKIGRTDDLRGRLARLQTGSPLRLHVWGAVALDRLRHDGPGDPPTFEAECHRRLADHRCRGEWFERDMVERFWFDTILPDQADYIVIDLFSRVRVVRLAVPA
jgi:hypothetical protein